MRGQFDSSAPIFMQIVSQMLNDIAIGKLALGEKIAPVRQLAEEYKVNPNTMQKSLEKLGDMGYLYTERTSGRFVTNDEEMIAMLRQKIPQDITTAYVKEMLSLGIEKTEILTYVRQETMLYNGGSANGCDSKN